MQRQRDGLMGRPRSRVSDGAPPDHRRVRGRAERARAHRYRQGRELGYRRAAGRAEGARPLRGAIDGVKGPGTRARSSASSGAIASPPTASPARAPAARSAGAGARARQPRAAQRPPRVGRRRAPVPPAPPRLRARRHRRRVRPRDRRRRAALPAPLRPDRRRHRRPEHDQRGAARSRAAAHRRAATPRRPLREPRPLPAPDRRADHRRLRLARQPPAPRPRLPGRERRAGHRGRRRRRQLGGLDNAFGYGNLVVVDHRLGFQSWYAHLSSVAVVRGQAVSGGVLIGRVGSTGHSTGPHLHFEVRRNGTPVDPAPLLLNSARRPRGAAGSERLDEGKVRCPRPPLRRGGGRYAPMRDPPTPHPESGRTPRTPLLSSPRRAVRGGSRQAAGRARRGAGGARRATRPPRRPAREGRAELVRERAGLVDLRRRPRARRAAVELEQADRLARGRRSGASSTAPKPLARAARARPGRRRGRRRRPGPAVCCGDHALGRRVVVEGEALAVGPQSCSLSVSTQRSSASDGRDGELVGVREALDHRARPPSRSSLVRTLRERVGDVAERGALAAVGAARREAHAPARARPPPSAATLGVDARPAGPGAAERVALPVGRRRSARASAARRRSSMPSAHTAAPSCWRSAAAPRAARSSTPSRVQRRWIERAVELEDVGLDADELLQPRVAGAGVVDGDPRAARAQRGELDVERVVGRESSSSVSSITMSLRSSGSTAATSGETSAAGLTLSVRNVPAGRPGTASATLDRARLERGAEPAAARLREPHVGRADRLGVQEARERLVAGDAARSPSSTIGWKTGVSASSRSSTSRTWSLLLGAREQDDLARVEAADLRAPGALGPVQRAVGELEQAVAVRVVRREGGDAGRAGRRRAVDLQLGEREPAALGDRVAPSSRVDVGQDERELLAADARRRGRRAARLRAQHAARSPAAPRRPRRGRRCR